MTTAQMQAIRIHGYGEPGWLEMIDTPLGNCYKAGDYAPSSGRATRSVRPSRRLSRAKPATSMGGSFFISPIRRFDHDSTTTTSTG